MRIFLLFFFLSWSLCEVEGYRIAFGSIVEANEVEVIEEIEIVEPTPVEETQHPTILGIPEHRLLKISGPVVWLAMAIAIATRHLKIQGKARPLSVIHKVCGYTAFGVGTIHGVFGLFF
jgi:hypothetical protein